MTDTPVRLEAEQKRRRRDFYIILAVIPLIILLTYLESHTSIISVDVPVATNLLVLSLINVNIILLVLLIFLVLRNAVKLFFESRSNVMGSRLRTKLIVSFVVLTIIPTFVLFFLVVGFINKSIDAWFDIKIEDALEESLDLARNYYKVTSDKTMSIAHSLSNKISKEEGFLSPGELSTLMELIEGVREDNDISTVDIYLPAGERVATSISGKVNRNMVPYASDEVLSQALLGEAVTIIDTISSGDVVRGLSPVFVEGRPVAAGAVVVSYYVPRSLMAKMNDIQETFHKYQELKLLKNPVKATYITILLIVTLLIVFFSIWVGRYIARQITVPIKDLAEGTHEVASGNLDYKITTKSSDEIGVLVRSFNRMTEDLKAGKQEIEKANLELRGTNTELEQRRRYIEIVLGNVPAGVLSIDMDGTILSINRVAADMLGAEEQAALGKGFTEVLSEEGSTLLSEMISEVRSKGDEAMEIQVKIKAGGNLMTVLVNYNALEDEDGNYIGLVAVMDDLTNLIKTQRMFAWKEVARRIAHEIKNPLTPIQLSAQRLRKKYMDVIPSSEEGVFDDCTRTIIRQVEELKRLVNEFSSFARMPMASPSPNDLNEIVEETVSLYRVGEKMITIDARTDKRLPILAVDRDQLKRVIINLMDNAIAAVGGDGRVLVETRYEEEKGLAIISVIDNGPGISPDDKQRLFEPYFSTKKSGTGLGLAIVSNIIADHNGYIKVKDNLPRGTKFIIELPVKVVPI